MGKVTGFLEYNRQVPEERDIKERLKDHKEVYVEPAKDMLNEQSARCMDCGVPFCHKGCPLGNNIPEFNDAVYQQDWALAYEVLTSTNNFPEFTGRICPAPCESSCVLSINKPAVAIEFIEKSIIEKAFEMGMVKPHPPKYRTGKKVAVIGSGPSGLATADQLNRAGHSVTVFEKQDRIGGLLRYGIPDFKLEKWVVARRVELMEAEGVEFKTQTEVGVDISGTELKEQYDAVVICTGSEDPRDLKIPGRSLEGIHFAMDFLRQHNKRVSGDNIPTEEEILATGKDVIVLGGGDTGSDCIGTSNRQQAKSIFQVELLEKPSAERTTNNPWPEYAYIFRTTSSHREGVERAWSLLTKEFIGDDNGKLRGVKVCDIKWANGRFEEVEGSERVIPCQMALLAIGYTNPIQEGLLQELGVELTARGNVADNNYQTSIPNVFTAGDARRGQSLVVWAISEGREAARSVDKYLMGSTDLPSKELSYTVSGME